VRAAAPALDAACPGRAGAPTTSVVRGELDLRGRLAAPPAQRGGLPRELRRQLPAGHPDQRSASNNDSARSGAPKAATNWRRGLPLLACQQLLRQAKAPGAGAVIGLSAGDGR